PDPVADAPLPRSPRRPGPHTLWGDGRGPAGSGPESGARAPAAPGVHALCAAYPSLLGPATDPRPGLRGPRYCADLRGPPGGRAGPHPGGRLSDSQPDFRHEHREPVPDAHYGRARRGQTDHGDGPADPGPHGAGALWGARRVDVLSLWCPVRPRLWWGD